MAKAIALTRAHFSPLADPVEIARLVLVTGSALALVLAGAFQPF